MTATTILQIAHHAWPSRVTDSATAGPVTAGRLTTAPLWRIEQQGRCFAMRGWDADDAPRAMRADRFARHVIDPPEVAVPVPIASRLPGGNTLAPDGGHLWELSPWLPGTAGIEAAAIDSQLPSACRTLALLHQRAADLPYQPTPSAVVRHDAALLSLQQRVAAGHFDNCEQNSVTGDESAGIPNLRGALTQGVESALAGLAPLKSYVFPVQWIWGDAWHNNFLFTAGEVTGLVDFATVRVDTPVADLARLLGSVADWITVDAMAAAIDAYHAIRPLCEAERRAVDALVDSGTVLSLANWLDWLLVERRDFNDAETAHQRLRHFAQRLATMLAAGYKNPQMYEA